MLEKLIKAVGYSLFLLQFVAIMTYQTFKYCWEVAGRLLRGSDIKDLKSPIQKVDPAVFASTNELIGLEGYRVETHDFQTEDGYVLTVWRLVANKPKTDVRRPYPVLIMHGLMDCGVTWFFQKNKNETLPYMLAELGFDVWIGNNRGTRYSAKGNERRGYWNFSFDEIAKYDVPTLINGVLNRTERQKLIYVGHSQGSTQLMARLTQDPQLAEKIILNIGLGTVLTLHTYSDDCILKILERFPILQFLKWLGFRTILSMPEWLVRLIAVLTYNIQFYPLAGSYLINFVCGFPKAGQSNIPIDRLGVIFSHEPGGSSIDNVIQWIHTSTEKRLIKFDHGPKENLKRYGQQKPPRYELEKLADYRIRTVLFRGTIDSVVSQGDFQRLAQRFPQDLLTTYHIPGYHHLDYIWAGSAHKQIHPEIVRAALDISQI